MPTPTPTDGLSLLNEDGELRVFFPRNSFVTNTTLTQTNTPGQGGGNDHIACYGGNPLSAEVKWYHSDGSRLRNCLGGQPLAPAPCVSCLAQCQANGGVGVDPPLNGSTDIHMYTNSRSYVNQDLECRVSGGQSAFIGVYLINGGECGSYNYDNT